MKKKSQWNFNITIKLAIAADCIGMFGVHRDLCPEVRYAVTHIPSGYKIRSFKEKEKATKLAGSLHKTRLFEEVGENGEIATELQQKLIRFFRKYDEKKK